MIPPLFRCKGDFFRCSPGKIPLLDLAAESGRKYLNQCDYRGLEAPESEVKPKFPLQTAEIRGPAGSSGQHFL
jgi:hypothetical protein